MEQSLADLLSDAFQETSNPSFADGDLDFENLSLSEEEKADVSDDSRQTKEDYALHQEATSAPETADVNMAESYDKDQSEEEDFQGVRVMSRNQTLEEDYTSSEGGSEQEGSVSEDDEDNEEEEEDVRAGEEPGDLLMSVCLGGYKEDRIFADGQPLAPQGAENASDRNREQGDKEVSYFKRVPEDGGEMGIKGDRREDDEEGREEAQQEDTSDSESEDMKIKQQEEEDQCGVQEVQNPYEKVKLSLEFPELSVKNLQDLLAEVEGEECVEKVENFSGEEHQEAGESFAEYPSDFSSCEYVEERHLLYESSSAADQNTLLEIERICMGRGENTDEEGDEYLYSRNLEDEDELGGLEVVSEAKEGGKLEPLRGDAGCEDGETDESGSCSSSDNDDDEEEEDDEEDEEEAKRSDEELNIYTENLGLQENREHREYQLHSGSITEFSTWSTSGDHIREDPVDLDTDWNPYVLTTSALQIEELLTTESTNRAETLHSDVTRPAEDVCFYSAVQREDTKTSSCSSQGSLDDSFFFNTGVESSGITELSQQEDDEYEEQRNWDQDRERIKSFYKFYDDNDKDEGGEERQIKVQFCEDPLSRVIHFESDSDRDSMSSSTDVEEDLGSAESSEQDLQEPVNNIKETKSALEPPNTEVPEDVPDLGTKQTCTRKHKGVHILKLTLKMAVVILMGLFMFWLVTEHEEMSSPASLLKGKA